MYSEETVLPGITLATAPDGNWPNADFIDGASHNSRLDMAVYRPTSQNRPGDAKKAKFSKFCVTKVEIFGVSRKIFGARHRSAIVLIVSADKDMSQLILFTCISEPMSDYTLLPVASSFL